MTQLSCEDTDLLAPPGCLTYNTETSGYMGSFNLANGTGELINNQRFSHCIKHQDGYCDIMLFFIDLDLGLPDWTSGDSGDSLTFGERILTGAARDLEVDNTTLQNTQILCKFI